MIQVTVSSDSMAPTSYCNPIEQCIPMLEAAPFCLAVYSNLPIRWLGPRQTAGDSTSYRRRGCIMTTSIFGYLYSFHRYLHGRAGFNSDSSLGSIPPRCPRPRHINKATMYPLYQGPPCFYTFVAESYFLTTLHHY